MSQYQPNPGQPSPYQSSPYQAGPYQPPGAPQPGQYYGPPPTNTMAILAIVFAFIFSPLGIIFGFIGRSQIRQTGEQGDGLALAGIIVGFVVTGLYVLGFFLLFALAATFPGTGYYP